MAFVSDRLRGRGRCLVIVLAALTGCIDGGGNFNRPRGNAIGERHADFMRVVSHLKTLPPGKYDSSSLPVELRLKNLWAVYAHDNKAYGLRFPSHPIDSDPIYVFVEEDVPDPESVVRAVVAEHAAWSFGRKLDEPGWYYVHGP